jgi:fumarate reductase flavoprotein subunit
MLPKNGVIGVRAQSGGKEIAVRAKKAIVLASGGYDFNKEMCRAFSPQQLWALETGTIRGAPSVTGDGIKLAMAVGADLSGMGGTISLPSVAGATGYGGIGNSAAFPAIWVNKYGQRFVNENSHYAYGMRAVFQQEEHIVWGVFDDNSRKLSKNIGLSEDLSKELADGRVKTGTTLAALADVIKVNVDQLQATVAKWNKDVAAGADTLFNKAVALKPIDAPAFYAARVVDMNLGVQGGVKINVKTQVIDLAGKVIPRLYAAGIVASGFLGPYYPGSGTALAFTVYSGRTAAKTGMGEQTWNPGM